LFFISFAFVCINSLTDKNKNPTAVIGRGVQ
jgi:hypothetical protein